MTLTLEVTVTWTLGVNCQEFVTFAISQEGMPGLKRKDVLQPLFMYPGVAVILSLKPDERQIEIRSHSRGGHFSLSLMVLRGTPKCADTADILLSSESG